MGAGIGSGINSAASGTTGTTGATGTTGTTGSGSTGFSSDAQAAWDAYTKMMQQYGPQQPQGGYYGGGGYQGGYPGYYGYNASANNPYMPAAVQNYGIPQYSGSGMYPSYGGGYGGGGGGGMGGMGGLGQLLMLGTMWPYLSKMFGVDSAGATTGNTTGNTTGTEGDPTYYDSLLNALYKKDFGRAYDPKTDSWWAEQLRSGKEDPNKLAQDIISGAQGKDLEYYNAHFPKTATTTGGTTTSPPTIAKWQAPTTAATDAAGKVAQIQNARSTTASGQGINDQVGANEVAAADWLVKNGFVPASTVGATTNQNLIDARSNPQIEDVLKGAAALGLPGFGVYNQGGRVGYSTGGKIPEMDRAFKHAKKYVDDHTKGLLDVHDDAIAHALHIAKGKL